MDQPRTITPITDLSAVGFASVRPEDTRSRARPHPALLVAIAAAYAVAGKLGLMVAIVHPSASAVWAPTGIALACFLRLGYAVWRGIFLGALIVNVTTAGSLLSSLGMATGNTLEGLIGAYLVNRFAHGGHAFDRARDTIRYTILAGMLSTMASATVGVASLASQGFARWAEFGSIWVTWWLGDLGGALVVAPLLLLWVGNSRIRWNRAKALEAGLVLLCLVVVGQVVFGLTATLGSKGHPLAFLCMPLLVWAAYRFSPRIASAAILVLSVVAVTGSLRSTATLERWELNQSLVMLQVFMGVAAATTLAFAALVAERARGEAAVRAASEGLRAAMTELEAFNYSISHDLRSPIGAVLNYSSAIEEDFGAELDEKGLRMLRGIRVSAESAASLLDQLVQLGWAGREHDEKMLLDMTSLAHDVHAEILTAGKEASEVHFDLRDLPPAWGSAALVRCVFRNLFTNAVKFTRGRPERRVQVAGVVGDRENAYWVVDNGVGFDPALGEAVFQPFRRLAHSAQYEGTGLGLAIAAKIVRRHGGRIWGESDGSNGARFCFTLPKNGEGT